MKFGQKFNKVSFKSEIFQFFKYVGNIYKGNDCINKSYNNNNENMCSICIITNL